MDNKHFIALDISGTNTSFGIIKKIYERFELVYHKTMKTKDIESVTIEFLNNLVKGYNDFNTHTSVPCCISIAGILNKEKTTCELTNCKLAIDIKSFIKKKNYYPVKLINDFEAIGYGIDHLQKEDIITIYNPVEKIKPNNKEVRAVIGAGTGLGKTIMIYDKRAKSYFSISSAGGHSDLPAINKNELELIDWIKRLRGGDSPVEYEDVLSGRGIERIYQFLNESKNGKTKEHENKNAEWISKHAKKNDYLCSKTFELFTTFYSRALRNFALEVMPRGGLYIAGGIAMKNHIYFEDEIFKNEFFNNHSQEQLLKEIPIFLINNYKVSLIGAGAVASLHI